MIIEFAVTNFRSINDRQVMDFRTDGQIGNKQMVDNIALPKDRSHGNSLLKTMAIYGANASGKSNFIKALNALELMVLNSDSLKLDKPIPTYEPFKLDRISLNAPTIFEIEFIAKDKKRYHYEIHFDKNTILKEKLDVFELEKKATFPTLIFNRVEDKIIDWKEGKDFSLNPNQLLLSKAGTNNIPSIREAYRFFSTYFFYGAAQSGSFDEAMLKMSELILSEKKNDHENLKKMIVSIIQAADTGIVNIFTHEFDITKLSLPEEMSEENKSKILEGLKKKIITVHALYENGVEVGKTLFDLSEESTGTMKLVGLAGIVAQALDDGSVIIMDELDKNLHPLLTRMIIGLFHNPDFNRNNAQLILSTHDISLIDVTLFRRDQIMFIDKDVSGKSSVRRLSDFTGISRVKQLEKWYMAGMFNAVPAINDYQIEMN
jgi:AAA15 family ATPase/GTPase